MPIDRPHLRPLRHEPALPEPPVPYFHCCLPARLFLFIATSNKNVVVEGIPFPVYYLTGMVAWGTMNAVSAGGGIIALERAVGWTRQLRITPLPVSAYMATKVASGYALACLTIVVLYIAAVSIPVHLTPAGGFS